MADRATSHQDTPNLHKDEMTGEMVSKSELKKRQKKREADKRKVHGQWLI
jgi:lysyl-tRNA synthetase class 2